MKNITLFIKICLLFSCSIYAIEYSVINFPDTLRCNKDSVIKILIENKSNNIINFKGNPNQFDIVYKDSNGNICNIAKYKRNADILIGELKPYSYFILKTKIMGYFLKDTIVNLNVEKDTMYDFLKGILKGTGISLKSLNKLKIVKNDIFKYFPQDSIEYILSLKNCLSPHYIKIPLNEGKYDVNIYLNLVDIEDNEEYYVIKSKLYINCK